MQKSNEKKSDKKAAIERLIRTNVRVGAQVRVCWSPKGDVQDALPTKATPSR